MPKFSLLFAAAGLLLLVAMAEAIFTTTTFDEKPTGRIRTDMSCSQQMAAQQMLNYCMMYLETSSGMREGRRRMSEPTPDEHVALCCMQLESIEEWCRRDAIKMMMNRQGYWTPQQMGQMKSMPENLPNKCNLKPDMCQMHAVWF